jgi:hypothetical protein
LEATGRSAPSSNSTTYFRGTASIGPEERTLLMGAIWANTAPAPSPRTEKVVKRRMVNGSTTPSKQSQGVKNESRTKIKRMYERATFYTTNPRRDSLGTASEDVAVHLGPNMRTGQDSRHWSWIGFVRPTLYDPYRLPASYFWTR